eukprot:g1375.t1
MAASTIAFVCLALCIAHSAHAILPLTTEKSDLAARSDFAAWKEHYGIAYDSNDSEEAKFQTFSDNRNLVISHNALYAKNKVSFSLELNMFADMTNEEFKAAGYTGSLNRGAGSVKQNPTGESTYSPNEDAAPPAAWDWRNTKNVVGPPKNQGQCGSCWAFSAVATMEGALNLKTGQLHSLSEQELVDCVNGGADTCQLGGEMYQGIEYAVKQGIESEKDYPYEGDSGNSCRYTKKDNVHTFKGYTNITSGNETALMYAAYEKPIVSVGIDASGIFFQLYFGGVYDPAFCSSTNLDHGVAVVGYGTYKKNNSTAGIDYWQVRNSWGAFWGKSGYIMMARNKNNKCGIATQACFADY